MRDLLVAAAQKRVAAKAFHSVVARKQSRVRSWLKRAARRAMRRAVNQDLFWLEEVERLRKEPLFLHHPQSATILNKCRCM